MSSQTLGAEWQITVDALEAMVILVDRAGLVIGANENAADTGARAGEPLASLPDPWPAMMPLLRELSPHRPSAARRHDDSASGRSWQMIARRIPGDSACVVIVNDVTNVVALEESVRDNERLAEMGQLVGQVAHEVRNPLFAMSATLDALEMRIRPHGLSLDRYMDNLRRELRRVTALMQDLLEYGKPPVVEARIEPIGAALCQALGATLPAASEKNITVECASFPDDDLALMDRARLAQAFQNVIENAVHFASPGSTVRIQVSREKSAGPDWMHCAIEDDGPGFSADTLPNVFEPFFTTRPGGTGLGLAIVRRIVQIHGGRVAAANREGGGARVTISLPLRSP
jgi:signal transduction histidine kinase